MRSSAKSVRLPPNKPSNKACSCRCQFCPTSLSSSPNHHPLLHSLSCSNPSCHFQPKTLWIGAMACTPNNPFYHVWPTAWMTLGTCKIRRLGRVMGRVAKVRVVKCRVVKCRVVTFTEAKDWLHTYLNRHFISSSHLSSVNAFKLLPISFVLAVYNNVLSNRFWQMNILGDGRGQCSLLSPSLVLQVPYL